MAKVAFGGLVAELRGTLGNDVYTRNRSGSIVRTKTANAYIHTANRDFAIQTRHDAVDLWANTLTQAQRDAWNGFAQGQIPTRTSLASNHLTGQLWFLRLNMSLLADVYPPNLFPPTDLQITQPTAFAITLIDVSATQMILTFAPPLDANHTLILQATPSISPGISNWKGKVGYIGEVPPETASPYNAWSTYITYRPTPVAGKRIGLIAKYLNITNGVLSCTARADAIVVA